MYKVGQGDTDWIHLAKGRGHRAGLYEHISIKEGEIDEPNDC